MMPQVIMMRYRRPQGHRFRLWIPVLPVLLILSPLLLLGIAVGLAACLYMNMRPWAALGGIGRVVWALKGTQVLIDNGDMDFMISFR